LAAGGYGYGPAFRGLRAAWRRGADVYAEVAVPADTVDPAGFGVHPALLDAVLHAIGLADEGDGGGVRLPFAGRDVLVHATGAGVLRARLSPDGAGGWSLAVADGTGSAVLSAGSLVLRPVTAGQLQAARSTVSDALFGVDWVSLPVPEQ